MSVIGRVVLFVVSSVLVVVGNSDARVVRFVVEETRIVAEGVRFGDVGTYQRLDGTAYMEVDPRDPLNAVIVNLDRAPRNGRGMVEFSAPFFLLKPTDITRGNGKIFYGVNNRGNKQLLTYFNFAKSGPGVNNPLSAADVGDGFLMRLGYTVVDAGWQGDVAPGSGRLVPSLPVATQSDGRPIVAPVRIEYSDRTIPRGGTFSLSLEGAATIQSYPTADLDPTHSSLSVRRSVNDSKVAIAPNRWAYGRCPSGASSITPTDLDICLFDGFRPDLMYELIYPAKNPRVMGLGYAVTRDIASFLRYQMRDDVGNLNPLLATSGGIGIRRAYSFGASSTGMYQREFLYLGFNEDESHRKVFDGLWIHKAGTHRLFANVEFADPNTYAREDDRNDSLGASSLPLSYAVTTDPISGVRDGLIKRPSTDPFVFQVDTSNEFWQMRASLNVTDGLGHPIQLPSNVRLYFLSSFQHGGDDFPVSVPAAAGMCQNSTNPNHHGPTVRALLMDLDSWVDRQIDPPRTNYPLVENGTLVTLEQAREAFPPIPSVTFPTALNGLEIPSSGIGLASTLQRLSGSPVGLAVSYAVFVPKPDRDGLDVAGVRTMEIRVPLGTNTGWNIRAPGFRSPALCGLNGSYIPFAKTKAERLTDGDPRRSVQERYKDHAGYVKAVKVATKRLMHERFLIKEDADAYVREAEASAVLR